MDKRDSLEWELIKSENIVNDEWIQFRRCAYRFPDGSVFEPFYTYSRRDYVVIVATDTEGNYLCVRQFRQGIGRVTTEFPAGGIERTDGKQYGARDMSAEDALEA
ncbi:MAG: NUDIX hydrolase, partial [Lachnospiraceae bacterium]|nr:NUDIX hydrolase [Lachnospiraceae bacterium]